VDFDKPLHLLKGSEAGYDIHLFKSYFQERFGLKTRFIKPSDLRLVPNKDVEHGSILYCTPEHPHFDVSRELPSEGLEQVHQVFLELHQHELQNLGSEILKALAPICFNDLRTIFLVHDKRMLGVVLHELDSLVIEHKVVKNDEALILRRSIVPTFIPGSQEFEREFANILDSKEEYILKPSGSGKGDGIVFGADLTPDLWLHSLENLKDARGEVPKCVVQRVVTQPKYNVIIPKNNSRSAVFQNPYVGTFMMANGKTLGIGCWRTSQNKICAVSEGGTWMWSLTSSTTNGINLASEITSTSILQPTHGFADITPASNLPRLRVSRFEDVSESNKVQAINEALQKHGLLILTLPFPDPQSQYLLCVIHCLRLQHKHGPPLTHSSTRGWFWDVRPNPSSVTEQKYTARSETTEEFPWHTDCSYASHPPKFFGLHVLQADRYGGGTLSVLLVESFVKNLSEETIEALSASEFRIDVPPEFADGTEFIVGPLLSRSSSSGNDEARIRFRADIIKPLTPRAETALEELNKELRRVREKGLCLDLKAEDLPNGSVVLIDNGRWLHARNKVKDEGRWLRRIRWDAREF
jgi:alpha-ketoglutarate-dependent taurine dioxygenase